MRSCAPKPCSTHAQDPSNYTAICGRVTGKQEVRSYRFEIGTTNAMTQSGVPRQALVGVGSTLIPGHLRLGVWTKPLVFAADAGHLWF